MKEEDIRPKSIFDEYLRLVAEDSIKYFEKANRVDGPCPACEGQGDLALSKDGFDYDLCSNCQTLYVNPRPIAAAFAKYYTESPSSKFVATTFYKETESARRERLWKPRVKVVLELLRKYGILENCSILDIGGGYGVFSEEMYNLSAKTTVIIEPSPYLAAICRKKKLTVVEKFIEDVLPEEIPSGPLAFVSFELFEHLHDPQKFLFQLSRLMGSGDLIIFTTISGLGVDVQALWEHSKSISPPQHLNFFNPRSIGILLERSGLQPVEVSTPGRLDLDILANNFDQIKDRFWRTVISASSDIDRQRWQEFISAAGFSSHMMVVGRKP